MPATKRNGLIFRVGPARQQGNKIAMSPVLWRLDNETDWLLETNGSYSHPLGPNVSSVDLTFKVYYAGLEREGGELKAGDYALVGKPRYNSWNSPVVATVWINGTPFNSFALVHFKAMQGWRQNRQTGQLENPMKAGADEIERMIPFMLKAAEPVKK
ncbi:MAG: hypothetical protein WEB50_02695 [Vicinamibacterales bacterium]